MESETIRNSGGRKVLLGIRDLKVCLPAKDFEQSKRFYTALGFKLSEGWVGTADFELDGNHFQLQDHYVESWADNLMVIIGVDDVEAWHQHVKAIADGKEFSNIHVKSPETVDYLLTLHVVDSSGVLLAFVQ